MASAVESTETYEQDTATYDWMQNDWNSGDDMFINVQGTYEVSLLPQGFYGVQLLHVLSELSGNQRSIVVLPVGGGPEIQEVFIEPGPGQFRRSPLPTGRLEFNQAELGESFVIKYVSSGTLTGKGYVENLINSDSDVLALIKSLYLNWDQRSSTALAELSGAAYGESSDGVLLFIMVATDGSDDVMVSRDGGLSWATETVSSGTLNWNAIAYGDELFVSVADGSLATGGNTTSCIRTTPGGAGTPLTWTTRTSPSARNWRGIVFGDNEFLIVGYSISSDTSTVATSPDGITWTPQTAIAGNWEDVAYGGGSYVAVRASGTDRVMTSLDGVTWFARTVPLKQWRHIAYGAGFFVAVSNESGASTQRIMRSDDGINWTLITTEFETSAGLCSIAFGNGVFVIGLDGGSSGYSFMVSSDSGMTWQPAIIDSSLVEWSALAYGDGIFAAGSFSSADIVTSLRSAVNG